jgi:wyosine [tRNA(Phe)-imidazoG37] synthetase (radical SAM superfamily)
MRNKYTYGPVASRRLGRSLGVDLVPPKTCNLNCRYCQLGPTERTTMERADYVPVADVVAEVRARLEEGPRPDYITLGGSGEPTLHRSFGDVAARIREFSDVPIALLTNGSLFYLPEVRAACTAVDLILPTLDAGDEETFRRINRPHPGLTLEAIVEGQAALRQEFKGQVWLEVFIVESVNTSDEQVRAIGRRVERIKPQRVQLNTAVRPPAEKDVSAASPQTLERIRMMLGPGTEIIAPVGGFRAVPGAQARKEDVLAILRRRPCTLEDIAAGLGTGREEAEKCVRALMDEGLVMRRQRLYESYYEAGANAPKASATDAH